MAVELCVKWIIRHTFHCAFEWRSCKPRWPCLFEWSSEPGRIHGWLEYRGSEPGIDLLHQPGRKQVLLRRLRAQPLYRPGVLPHRHVHLQESGDHRTAEDA